MSQGSGPEGLRLLRQGWGALLPVTAYPWEAGGHLHGAQRGMLAQATWHVAGGARALASGTDRWQLGEEWQIDSGDKVIVEWTRERTSPGLGLSAAQGQEGKLRPGEGRPGDKAADLGAHRPGSPTTTAMNRDDGWERAGNARHREGEQVAAGPLF